MFPARKTHPAFPVARTSPRLPRACHAALLAVLLLAGLTPGAAGDDRDARRALVEAINGRDLPAVAAASSRLIELGGKDNLATFLKLIPRIPDTEDGLYWALVQGACSFRDREAMEYLGEILVRRARTATSRDLLFGLSKNTSRYTLAALGPILEKGQEDMKVLATQKIAKIPVPESVDILIAALKREEEDVRDARHSELLLEIADALSRLTGQNFGPLSINWEGWWAQNRTARLGPRDNEDDHGDGGHTGTVVDSLRRTRREEFYGLERAPKRGVVVLSASYDEPIRRDLNNDRIQVVLQRMRIPHTVVRRQDFLDYDLSQTGALVINCAQFHKFCVCPTCKPAGSRTNRLRRCTGCNEHIQFSAELPDEAIAKIVRFVRGGGYLFGEDWIVKEVLERAYPKYVRAGTVLRDHPVVVEKGDPPPVVGRVDVHPARGRATHPYLRGIFIPDEIDPEEVIGGAGKDPGRRGKTTSTRPGEEGETAAGELVELEHRWSVDDESWAFDILNQSKVLVLLSSGELQQKAEGQGVVAFAFSPGQSPENIGGGLARRAAFKKSSTSRSRGRAVGGGRGPGVVLQVLSHFGKQGSARDEYLLQNLLLNFLIDANVERQIRLGPDDPGTG